MKSYVTREAKRVGLNRLIERGNDAEYQRFMRRIRVENIRRTKAAQK